MPNALTPAEMAEARALCDAATPGPWVERPMRVRVAPIILANSGKPWGEREIAQVRYHLGSEDPDVDANARFIVASRDLLPRALDTIAARDEEVARLRKIIDALAANAVRIEPFQGSYAIPGYVRMLAVIEQRNRADLQEAQRGLDQ